MKTKIAKGYNLKLHTQNIHENIFAKAFNLKVHKQNVHEIEKISTKVHAYELINDIMESTILKDTY